MRLYLIAGIVALVLAFLALRWFVRTPAPVVANALRRGLPWVAIAVLVLLVATGRLNWLYAAIGAVFAALPRLIWLVPLLLGLYRRYRARRRATRGGAGGAAPGQTSQVEARFVRMSLDHGSGEIAGTVLEGRFKGAHLHELSLDQLIELLRECRLQDEESARLVEAFLDRVHGDEWRAHAAAGDGGAAPTGGMSVEEACEVLGLKADASEEEIVATHRRLMQKLHPDRGGSAYLAARINQAKDVLLRARG